MNEEESRAKDDSDPARSSAPDGEPGGTDQEQPEKPAARRARRRARLTLRIPDDDVARPEASPPADDSGETPAPPEAKTDEVPAVLSQPIIALGEVTGPDAERLVRASSRPPPPFPTNEEKTPLVPPAARRPRSPAAAEGPEPAAGESSGEDLEVVVDEPPVEPASGRTSSLPDSVDVPIEEDEAPGPRDTEVVLPSLADSSEVPVGATGDSTMELDLREAEEVTPLAPPVARRPSSEPPTARLRSDPPLRHLSDPPRPMAQAILDAEEASTDVDRESSVPIEPEDLVSVESSPAPAATPKTASAPKLAVVRAPAGTSVVSTPAAQPQLPAITPPRPVQAVRPPLVIVPSHATTPSPLAPHGVSETTAARRRGRPWWEDLFGEDFVRTMPRITDDQIASECDFIEDSLGVARGGSVLDLACGTGRHAIELARRGYNVVGFDLSLAMLARAADEAQERDQKINFVHGDMREMTFDETFDGIYCWNTSYGFFEEEKNAAVIGKVHRALRQGGQFLLDVVNRDFVTQQSPSLAWFEGDACICMDEMQVDFITSRMKIKRTMMFDDGRTREIDYQIRIYALHELGKLLHDHGFRVIEVSGNCTTPGVFFGTTSPRAIVLVEKR